MGKRSKRTVLLSVVLSLILLLMCFTAACSGGFEEYSDTGSDESATVTGSGEEYHAVVDQDGLTCSVEYEGTSLEVDEGEFVSEDGDFFVLRMTFSNDLDLITHDSNVDDLENKDAMYRSYVVRAVQGDKVIDPRGEEETENFEEDNVYESIDAGSMIECEYWFPVDTEQPVTIQILNPDGEDTVMAELTFPADME